MPATEENNGLVWFTQNLRVHDNRVLNRACENHTRVIGVFFIDPALFEPSQFGFKKIGRFRAQFLLETLAELKRSLRQLNISLLVILDSAQNRLPDLINLYSISTVYHQNEWTYEEQKELEAVQNMVSDTTAFEAIYDQFLIAPEDLKLQKEAIPLVFTNFRKWIEKYCKPQTPIKPLSKPASNLLVESHSLPTIEDLGFRPDPPHAYSAFPFQGGEQQALNRIEDYFFNSKKLGVYKKTRNGLLGIDYSSKLSAWLANGSISARSIYQQVRVFEKQHYSNQSTYWLIFELLWRDYFKYISLKFGNAIFYKKGILNRDMPDQTNPTIVEKWVAGRTDDDFVNANMNELRQTGWMSNRGRQNAASYFARTLHQDWRIGAAYFETQLIDYDVHSNYGNWMYVAGVGNDPRSRVFNCKLQADRYDPKGKYRRQWLQANLF